MVNHFRKHFDMKPVGMLRRTLLKTLVSLKSLKSEKNEHAHRELSKCQGHQLYWEHHLVYLDESSGLQMETQGSGANPWAHLGEFEWRLPKSRDYNLTLSLRVN